MWKWCVSGSRVRVLEDLGVWGSRVPPLLVALCTPELWSRTRVLLGTPEDPAREQLLALWLCHWCHPLPFPSWMGTVPLEPCPVWLERLQASAWDPWG